MINIHIYPSTFEYESRILKVTEALVTRGVVERVLIIAIARDGLQERQVIDEAREVLRIRSRINGSRLILKIARFVEWSINVFLKLSNQDVTMVNCHSLSVLPLCVILKWWHQCILVYEPHELETETIGSKGLRKMLAKVVERIFIRFADQTFVVSESIADEYARIHNMIAPPVVLNCPKYMPPIQSNLLREHLCIPDDAVIFLYQGSLASGRGVSVILEAFKKIADPRKVIVFMGSGPLEEEIKEVSHKCANIYHHPSVPSDAVLQYTASADIGMHLIQNTCLNHYYCMPNKLFEYSMAGLPVIVSNMLEMSRFVRKNRTGVVARDESPDTIVEAIDELMQMKLPSLKSNAFDAAKQYCWEEQEKVMISNYLKLFSREQA